MSNAWYVVNDPAGTDLLSLASGNTTPYVTQPRHIYWIQVQGSWGYGPVRQADASYISDALGETIVSGGHHVIRDGSCNPNGTTDQSFTDAMLGPLADNGGPTFTHALGAGTPAIDAASAGVATDQRGVARPQGAGSDVGSFELAP